MTVVPGIPGMPGMPGGPWGPGGPGGPWGPLGPGGPAFLPEKNKQNKAKCQRFPLQPQQGGAPGRMGHRGILILQQKQLFDVEQLQPFSPAVRVCLHS